MQKIEIGQIVNTFGIKGEVKIKPFTDNIKQFDSLKSVYIKDQIYKIENVKYHKNMIIIKFDGINKIEDAENLRNYYIEIEKKDAKELEEGSYYIVDLIGLDVYEDTGAFLGKLDDIYNTGSNDIYVVKTNEGKQILLPAISDVIKEINLENKTITVHMLKGLI